MVERRQSTRKRIMREFTINEISAVDRPAQGHAKMTIMKRADDVEKKYKTIADLPAAVRNSLPTQAQHQYMAVVNSVLSGGGSDASAATQAWGALKNSGWSKNKAGKWVKKDYYGDAAQPVAISQDVQAVDFDTVLAEDEARDAAREVGDDLREKWCALQRAFATIAADESVSAPDKITAMQASLQQYIDSLAEQSQTIADEMTKRLTTAVPALAELLKQNGNDKGDDPMTDAEKRQLDELQKNVKDLTAKLEAATAKEPAKKAADLQGELDAAKAQVEELTKKIADGDAEKAEAVAKAAMSDAEKAHMATLSGKAKMDFMQAAPADRKKMMSKAADEDPVVYKSESTGEEFRKSDDPRLVKMARQADESEKLAKAEREKRETAEIAKRADEDPYKTFAVEKAAGDKDDVAKTDVVAAIMKMDEGPRAVLEKWLGIGSKAVAAAFQKIGHSHETAQKSATDFNKRVAEIAARDKITHTAAMTKARIEYPDEYAALQNSASQAN